MFMSDLCACDGGKRPARPLNPDWVRQIRDQCAAAGVRFVFEGWGEFLPWDADHIPEGKSLSELGRGVNLKDGRMMPDGAWPVRDGLPVSKDDYMRYGCNFARVGPERSGRLLDGREWR